MAYRNILLAVDFSEHGVQATERAQELARAFGARLYLLHVVEYIPPVDSAFAPELPMDVDLTEEVMAAAQNRLYAIAESVGATTEQCRIEVGSAKTEILRVAAELPADLIVLGSHGRRGIGALLGSTASSIVNHARCDVLAIRLRD